ncbi:MAG: hypothetical protein ABIB61_00055 [Candidatus Shapirobacteria bacterium]
MSKKKKIIIEDFLEALIIRPKDSAKISVNSQLQPHYNRQTEFNHCVIKFGNFFDDLKNSLIPLKERWPEFGSMPTQVFLCPQNEAMDQMTIIANNPRAYFNKDLKKKYRLSLAAALKEIAKKANLSSNSQKIAIKRAGVVAANLLRGPNKALIYEAKRLPFLDGALGVGVEDEQGILAKANLDNQDLEIDEVFLASGSTILAFIIDCHSRSIKPKSLTIIAPFTTQLGAKTVLDLSRRLGWNTKILANRIYYQMDDHWYVLVTPQEAVWKKVSKGNKKIKVQAGGDAGDLTEKD